MTYNARSTMWGLLILAWFGITLGILIRTGWWPAAASGFMLFVIATGDALRNAP